MESVGSGTGVLAFAPIGPLLLLVAGGDTDAFSELVDRVFPLLLAVARSVASEEQAEQVATRTLLQVWRTAGTFDPLTDGAASWLGTIAAAELDAAGRDHSTPLLTIDQARCLRLAVRRQYTYPQIAETLLIPFDTVLAHLRDGLVNLRSLLQVDTFPA